MESQNLVGMDQREGKLSLRGSSSVVECLLPKEKIAGSNPVCRSAKVAQGQSKRFVSARS